MTRDKKSKKTRVKKEIQRWHRDKRDALRFVPKLRKIKGKRG